MYTKVGFQSMCFRTVNNLSKDNSYVKYFLFGFFFSVSIFTFAFFYDIFFLQLGVCDCKKQR